jgi:hypothetical protein
MTGLGGAGSVAVTKVSVIIVGDAGLAAGGNSGEREANGETDGESEALTGAKGEVGAEVGVDAIAKESGATGAACSKAKRRWYWARVSPLVLRGGPRRCLVGGEPSRDVDGWSTRGGRSGIG